MLSVNNLYTFRDFLTKLDKVEYQEVIDDINNEIKNILFDGWKKGGE